MSVLQPSSFEISWREYMARHGYPNGDAPQVLEASQASFSAGYAAGAGFAAEVLTRLIPALTAHLEKSEFDRIFGRRP